MPFVVIALDTGTQATSPSWEPPFKRRGAEGGGGGGWRFKSGLPWWLLAVGERVQWPCWRLESGWRVMGRRFGGGTISLSLVTEVPPKVHQEHTGQVKGRFGGGRTVMKRGTTPPSSASLPPAPPPGVQLSEGGRWESGPLLCAEGAAGRGLQRPPPPPTERPTRGGVPTEQSPRGGLGLVWFG